MRTFKKIFVIFLILFSFVFLSSCEKGPVLKLTAEKTELAVTEKTTITAKVIVGKIEEEILPTTLEFKSSDDAILSVSSEGVVEGKALGTATITASLVYKEIALDAKLEFTVKDIPLAPQSLSVENAVLTWLASTGATSYIVEVNGVEHSVTQTSFDFKTTSLPYGTYEIKVSAKKGEELSAPAIFTFVYIDPKIEADIYKELLSFINETYTPDMKETDFTGDWEYTNYLNYSKIAKAYTSGSIQAEISLEKTKELIKTIEDSKDIRPNNFEELKLEFDKYIDLDIQPSQITIVFMELALETLSITKTEAEESVANKKISIAEEEANLLQIQTDPDYINYIAKVNAYLDSEEKQLFASFLAGEEYMYEGYSSVIKNINNYLQYNDEYMLEYYKSHDQPIICLLAILMERAYLAEDSAFLTLAVDTTDLIEEARYVLHNLEYLNTNLKEAENLVKEFSSLNELVILHKDDFLTSFNASFTYIFDFYEHLDSGLIDMLDSLFVENTDEITVEEIIILKDEVIDLLLTTLPTAAEFENMYLAQLIVMYDFLEINPEQMLSFSQVLGQIENKSLQLILNMLKDIDATFVNDVIDMAANLMVPGECYTKQYYNEYYDETYEYTYCDNDTPNPTVVVDLVVYIGKYLDELFTDYKLQIEAISALNSITFSEQIDLIINKIIAKLDTTDETQTIIMNVLNNYLTNKETYTAVYELNKKYGSIIFDKFILSNGKIAYDIINFVEEAQDTQISDLADDLKVIFDQLFDYHDLTVEELTAEEIDLLVNNIIINLKFSLFRTVASEFTKLETVLENITPDLKTILKNLIKLEIDVINALETNNAAYEFAFMSDVYNYDQSLAIQFVKALNLVLTTENKKLIDDSIDLVFDEILTDSALMELNNMTLEEITEVKNNVLSTIESLYEDVAILSTYDYNNLTEEQTSEFTDFVNYLFGPTYN